jgi:transposase
MNKHNSNFKAKVALEAIREIETIAEIGRKYNIHPRQVQTWKADALKNFENLFIDKRKPDRVNDNKLSELERKIGQLVLENDFLKKSSLKLPQ